MTMPPIGKEKTVLPAIIGRRTFITAAAALGPGRPPAHAAANSLYQARTIVTGRMKEC